MDRWAGRVALVTGASEGIGAAIAKALIKAGMKVAGCARGLEKLQKVGHDVTSASGSFLPIQCDMLKEDEILSMFARIKAEWGGVDVCINNAGLARNAPLLSGDTAIWRNMMELNVMSLSICTREAVKSMRERGVDDGHVIHINSIFGHKPANSPIFNFLGSTKYAITALTEGLRNELRAINSHIRITSVSPGITITASLPKIFPGQPDLVKHIHHDTRRLDAVDIADAVVYALSCPPHVQVHEMIVRGTEED